MYTDLLEGIVKCLIMYVKKMVDYIYQLNNIYVLCTPCVSFIQYFYKIFAHWESSSYKANLHSLFNILAA